MKNKVNIGDTDYFVVEHYYHLPDKAGARMEYMPIKGTVTDFIDGGYKQAEARRINVGVKRDIYERVKAALKKLNSSRDMEFTEILVRWDKRRSFSVECVRMEGDLTDDDGNVIWERDGKPAAFEVYYRVDGADMDCCTLTLWLDERDFKDLAEFIDMYR